MLVMLHLLPAPSAYIAWRPPSSGLERQQTVGIQQRGQSDLLYLER